MKTTALFLCSFLWTTMLLGQEVKKDSVISLDEVILLDANRSKSAIGITPSSTIGPKTFQNYSPIEAVSAINQIAGVYILSGALNTNRATIRGIGARTPFGTDKLRLYYNDIPVTSGNGFSTLETYDPENLGQIEVIKGPKGTAYGTNLGGALLLKTKGFVKEATRFSNNFTTGSFNLVKNSLSFNHAEEKFSIGLQYGHFETDGFRENNSFDRHGLLLHSSYNISTNSSLSFLVNYVDYTAQIPSSLSQDAFEENPRQAAANWLAAQGFEANKYTLIGLSYAQRYSPRLQHISSVFYTYLDQFEARPFNIVDEFTNGFGFRSRLLGDFLFLGQDAHYSLGTELYHDEFNNGTFENLFAENNGNGSLQGNQIGATKEFRRQLNLFGTLTLPLTPAFQAQLGLSVNKTKFDFRDQFNTGAGNTSAERSFDAILLPSLTLNYDFTENHSIYANISRGFSNPGFEETLTPDGAINPDIDQETGTNYELGTQLALDRKRFRLNLALYRMDVQNLLVAERIAEDQFIGRNAGSTKHQGLELDANYAISIAAQLQLTPFISYTLNDHSFVDFRDGDDDFSGNPLTGVPKHRVNSGIQVQHTSGFYWNTTHQYVGAIPLTDANTLSSESFNVYNTRIGYKKRIFKSITAQVDFGINNLWNTRYTRSVVINARGFGGAQPRFFNPGDGRNYYGSLQLRYTL
ncbi:TonB-dependent receptor family protein [Spongiimicrobium salis]|uniref:TonB-dependent receptor family protein n=1 Tax=Spongiimicrobium salis TaxID=1667022 RepID=UPI00374D504C